MKIITFIMVLASTVLMAVPQAELVEIDAFHDANQYETELTQLEKLSAEFPEDVEILWRLAQVHFDIADQTEDEEVHKAHFYPGFESAKEAAFVNGKLGEFMFKQKSYGYTASDMVKEVWRFTK